VNFDRTVLNGAIGNIERLKDDLAERPAIASRVENTLVMLRNIRDNDSMRNHYATIYNQCVVLLVSHFGSALHDIFVAAAPLMLSKIQPKELEREELKFSLPELRELNYDLHDVIGDLLVTKRNISFQDMQSTIRAFETYCGIRIERDSRVNNIILAQAARHVIVHAGGKVDVKCSGQLRAASPREVKQTVTVGDLLVFTPGEIEFIAASMRAFIGNIVADAQTP